MKNLRQANLHIYGLENSRNTYGGKYSPVICDKMKLSITNQNTDACYKLKQSGSGRTVVFHRLNNVRTKQLISARQKMLKDTGIVITEDLLEERYGILKVALEKIERKHEWS